MQATGQPGQRAGDHESDGEQPRDVDAEALDVFDFEPVAKQNIPVAHWGYLATGTGFVLAQARAQAFRNGFFDQTAQLWNEAGEMLVTSHQIVYFKA